MKDCSTEMLESSRPKECVLDAVNFCLRNLDGDTQKHMQDIVAGSCTYEELIGALLLARDQAERDMDISEEMPEKVQG